MNSLLESSSGDVYCDYNWLEEHHSLKSRMRANIINDLGFYSGESVLDFGCGTGGWSTLLSDRVGIDGNVLGVDSNSHVIDYCKNKYRSLNKNNLEFDIIENVKESNFDSAIAFNVLSYPNDPVKLLKKILTYIKPSGCVYIKDTNILSDFYWPLDEEMLARVQSCLSNSFSKNRKINGYDPAFSLRLPRILNSIDGVDFLVHSYSFTINNPLSPIELSYIKANAKLIYEFIYYEDSKLAKEWMDLFDVSNEKCIYKNDLFNFTMCEYIYTARFKN